MPDCSKDQYFCISNGYNNATLNETDPDRLIYLITIDRIITEFVLLHNYGAPEETYCCCLDPTVSFIGAVDLRTPASLMSFHLNCLVFRCDGWFRSRRKDGGRRSVFLMMLLLIAGVEPNPGPSAPLWMGVLNGRFIANKGALVQDVIIQNKLDILVITETSNPSDAPDAIKFRCTPDGYRVHHVHRGDSSKKGGGLAIVYRDGLKIEWVSPSKQFDTFECQVVTVTSVRSPLTIVNIYRPPITVASNRFAQELHDFVDSLMTSCKPLIICGDFNCPYKPNEEVNEVISDFFELLWINSACQGCYAPGGECSEFVD